MYMHYFELRWDIRTFSLYKYHLLSINPAIEFLIATMLCIYKYYSRKWKLPRIIIIIHTSILTQFNSINTKFDSFNTIYEIECNTADRFN